VCASCVHVCMRVCVCVCVRVHASTCGVHVNVRYVTCHLRAHATVGTDRRAGDTRESLTKES